MKNRVFVALLLAVVIALPVVAQTNSATQDQPTTTSQPAQSTDQSSSTTMGASGKQPLGPPAREGFWGRVNPFARKKYVQRQTAPIRDRINELDELTASNSKMIKDVDLRAQEGKAAVRAGIGRAADSNRR